MRLVVFDMDGTLIDTAGLIAETMAQTFSIVGLVPPGDRAARSVIGLSLPVAMHRLTGNDDELLIEKLVSTYRETYREAIAGGVDREPLYPGARDALDRLRNQDETLLGVATGKALHGVRRILDLHALSGHFATLQTPDHNPSKPHPGMLISAMRETGVGPQRTVMIGDTTYDVQLGRAAGVATIGVAWGYHSPADLRDAGADVVIEDFDGMGAAIDGLVSKSDA